MMKTDLSLQEKFSMTVSSDFFFSVKFLSRNSMTAIAPSVNPNPLPNSIFSFL